MLFFLATFLANTLSLFLANQLHFPREFVMMISNIKAVKVVVSVKSKRNGQSSQSKLVHDKE